jgi:acetyl esterase/lipase
VSNAAPADAGIAPTLLENPWFPRPTDRIGFYGCSSGGGRIVRLAWLGRKGQKPPRTLSVDCPACGFTHNAVPTWRAPTDVDEGREPELAVTGTEPETTP